jgi:hypothetical protein
LKAITASSLVAPEAALWRHSFYTVTIKTADVDINAPTVPWRNVPLRTSHATALAFVLISRRIMAEIRI